MLPLTPTQPYHTPSRGGLYARNLGMIWRRHTQQVDYEYTSDEQARGLSKLVEAAVGYDATGPASLGLGAFQVRRVWHLKDRG